MLNQPTGKLTAGDLYDLPDDGCRYEICRGRLVAEPAPGFRHGRIVAAIVRELQTYVHQHLNGLVITADSGFLLARNPDTVRAPDVAFVRRERCEALLDEPGHFPGAPDLAVEVLSPSDRERRIARKVADYLDAGTLEVWLADPERHEVRVCTASAQCVRRGCDSLQSPQLTPGLTILVATLFRSPWH